MKLALLDINDVSEANSVPFGKLLIELKKIKSGSVVFWQLVGADRFISNLPYDLASIQL